MNEQMFQALVFSFIFLLKDKTYIEQFALHSQ